MCISVDKDVCASGYYIIRCGFGMFLWIYKFVFEVVTVLSFSYFNFLLRGPLWLMKRYRIPYLHTTLMYLCMMYSCFKMHRVTCSITPRWGIFK